MIDFRPITPFDKELYLKNINDGVERGCEFSFANLVIWGNQNIAEVGGCLVLFSDFDGRYVYPYPIGKVTRTVVDSIIEDAKTRGICCRINGITDLGRECLEREYPENFDYKTNAGAYDYIYNIDDLADLKGKKYQSKRNHINRVKASGIEYSTKIIDSENLKHVGVLFDRWCESKLSLDPDFDFEMEREAFKRMSRYYSELGAEGMVLVKSGEIVAFTIATRFFDDTFDVHFEKALSEADGAYAIINSEFAKYIRAKYPEVKYLNREEDMGIEGLRRAKESYRPCKRIVKYRAKYKG